MATELNHAAFRPLIIAATLFALIASASFGWAAIEGQGVKRTLNETRVVALPS